MGLKDYWTQPAQAQDMLRADIQPAPSYLRPPKPKGCHCRNADARRCFVLRQPYTATTHRDITCGCACHYETGGFD